MRYRASVGQHKFPPSCRENSLLHSTSRNRNICYVLLTTVKITHCLSFSILFKWPDLNCLNIRTNVNILKYKKN